MKPVLKRLLRRPLAWSLVLGAVAGCATIQPAPIQAPTRQGAAPIPLRVVPVLREGGYRLQAFEGWQATQIATLTARLYDVTAGGADPVATDAFASPDIYPNSPDAGFDLGGLHWDRTYRVELRAYRAVGASSEAISVDDLSSATFDTNGVNGRYPTAKTLALPLVLDARPFPGLLDVVVDGVASQDFMRVVLRRLEPSEGQSIATTVMLAGEGSATLSFGDLDPDATYVVERFPYMGTVGASTALVAAEASTVVSTDPATATVAGRVATVTVGTDCNNPAPVYTIGSGGYNLISQLTDPVAISICGAIVVYPRSVTTGLSGLQSMGKKCVSYQGETHRLDWYLQECDS